MSQEQESSQTPVTPLPWSKLIVISSMTLGEAIMVTMIFPFLYNMIDHFDVAGSEDQIGFYAGMVASSFNFSQFISAFIWGRLSDKFGRRPILLIGLFGNIFSLLLFGFSLNLVWAILARSLNGLLNGNVGVAKCYLLEVSDDTNSARAFSILGFSWGLGGVIGPIIGGYLSNPDDKYPHIFPDGSIWDQFPYLLPALLAASLNLFAFILGWFVLEESHPALIRKRQLDVDDEDVMLKKSDATQEPLDNDLEDNNLFPEEKLGDWKRIFKERDVWLTSFIYGLLAWCNIGWEEVFAVWIITSVRLGGLNFTSEETATAYLVQGTTVIVAQMVISRIIKAGGPLLVFKIAVFYFGLVTTLFPFLNLFTSWGKTYLTVGLCVLMGLRGLANTISFTTVFLLVNHSTVPDLLGSANGIAQSAASLSRGIGPLIGGVMLSWSLSNDLSFPFDHYFSFFIFGLGLLLTSVFCFILPDSINVRKKQT